MTHLDEPKTEQLPELYSKTLILMFAILFSTIFAAALLIVNLRYLGRTKPALWVGIFAFAFIIATAGIIQFFNLSPSMTIIANVIGAAILNEYFWNKYIGEIQFTKKSWIKPALLSVAIAIGFYLVLMGGL